jgi:dipeptidyl aminopeptidase/acylaminoacyl peptidase
MPICEAPGARTSPAVLRRTVLAVLAGSLFGLAGCDAAGREGRNDGPTVRPAEWRAPGGAHAALRAPTGGRAPRGLIMVIHGGGWRGLSPALTADVEPAARAYNSLGYATVVPDYPAGEAGVADLDRFYRRARRAVGPKVPICAVGGSAGGHLSLVLAARHPDLRCVIAQAAPTDLVALSQGNQLGHTLPALQFGAARLDALSPARHAERMKARLLLVYATNDPYVPLSQGREMARARPGARLIVLRPGSAPFVHSDVDAAAKAGLERTELRFLTRATRGR